MAREIVEDSSSPRTGAAYKLASKIAPPAETKKPTMEELKARAGEWLKATKVETDRFGSETPSIMKALAGVEEKAS